MDGNQPEFESMASDQIVVILNDFHTQYPFVGTLLLIMIMDLITGVIAAWITKSISSSISYRGVGRKVLILFAVSLGAALQPYAGKMPLAEMISVFYIYSESVSIVENLGRSGVPFPKALMDVLSKLRSERDTKPVKEPDTSPSISIMRAETIAIHQTGTEKEQSAIVIVPEDTGQKP